MITLAELAYCILPLAWPVAISDKLIASITGHTDMKTLNQYYQVDDDSKKDAVNEVFNLDVQLLKKVQ